MRGFISSLPRLHADSIIISSFASNVHRIQQVVDGAMRFNRKIAFLGRSMVRNVELARELRYLKIDKKMMVPIEDIGRVPDNQLVILTTGSQGKPFSGLPVINTINRLFALSCEVVYEQDRQTHVSGHASSEELGPRKAGLSARRKDSASGALR